MSTCWLRNSVLVRGRELCRMILSKGDLYEGNYSGWGQWVAPVSNDTDDI